jgi:hypothetical protein
MNFPMIYVNGCSYSDSKYHSSMLGKNYGHFYGDLVNGFVLSRAQAGSCNRRIIRTTAHDLIEQRKLNPTQKIIALIQSTFEIRDELWHDDITQPIDPCESNFHTHQFSYMKDWHTRLLKNQLISNDRGFLKKWGEGRAFFYNGYAERINLLLDVLFLKTLLQSLNIEYLIFQGPIAETLEKEYLKDFFLSQLDDPRILNFETFGFCNWCHMQRFDTIDSNEPKDIGHYKADAHQAFAEKFLANIL